MTDSTTDIVFGDIETALSVASEELPTLLNAVATFYPPAAAIAKFLPLIQVALAGVQTVQQATGIPAQATQEVINHLTPGQPNSPTLSAAKD